MGCSGVIMEKLLGGGSFWGHNGVNIVGFWGHKKGVFTGY